MNNVIWCMVDHFEDVLLQEPAGAEVIGVSKDDFISLSVAGALGETDEVKRLTEEMKQLKTGTATGPERNKNET